MCVTRRLTTFTLFALTVYLAPAEVLCPAETFENPVIREYFADPTFWTADDGWIYGTSSGLVPIKRSRDLVHWENTNVPAVDAADLEMLKKFSKRFWAPDAVRIGKTYHLYFTQFVSSDTNRLVCATSERPEGPFRFRSVVLENWKYGKKDCAIDAEVIVDGDKIWLFTGSVAGGVWRTRLTPDGLAVDPSAPFEHVAGLIPKRDYRPWIYSHRCYEGSYLYRRGKWWYLFVSCGAIDNGTYRLCVGRSERIDGVFRDKLDVPLTESGGEQLLVTNPDSDFSGPGHNGDIFTDRTGRTYMFIHSQWKGCPAKGKPWRSGPRCTSLQEVKWTQDGWPYFETGSLVPRERIPETK